MADDFDSDSPSASDDSAGSAGEASSQPKASSQPAASGPPPRRSPHRPRQRAGLGRWLFRLVVGIFILLVLAVIAIQIVLMTAFPKSIVLGQIEKQLGLRAQASSLSVGWFGHVGLRDVKLGLPLAEGAVVEVPKMDVEATWLPLILIGRPVQIKSIVIDHPTLYVQQNDAGQWNVLQVVELVLRTGGKNEAADEGGSPTAPPDLPGLRIIEATVLVSDNVGRKTTIQPVNVTGKPLGALVYSYDVQAPDHVSINGRVAPGGAWQHEVTLNIQQINDWLRPWAGELPPIALAGEWRGQAGGAGVSGRFQMDRFRFADNTVRGTVAMSVENGTVVARPERLTIRTPMLPSVEPPSTAPPARPALAAAGPMRWSGIRRPARIDVDAAAASGAWIVAAAPPDPRAAPTHANPAAAASPPTTAAAAPRQAHSPPTGTSASTFPSTAPATSTAPAATRAPVEIPLVVTGGRLVIDGKKVEANGLEVLALGGVARLDGSYQIESRSGQASAQWSGLSFPAGSDHGGSLKATLSPRLQGGPNFTATLTTQGKLSGAQWTGQIEFSGGGGSWTNLNWSLTAPTLHVVSSGKPPLSLNGFRMAGRVYPEAAPGAAAGASSPVVAIDSLSLPDRERLNGSAKFNIDTKVWRLDLDGAGWPIRQADNEPLTFRVRADGNAQKIAIDEIHLQLADVNVDARGSYFFDNPEPVDVKVTVARSEARPAIRFIEEVRGEEPPFIGGSLYGVASVTGTIEPDLNLKIDGKLTADGLTFQGKRIGTIKADLHGVAGYNESWGQKAVRIQTSMLQAVGGNWDVSVVYLFDNESTGIDLRVKDLPLAEAARLAGQRDVAGAVEGHWNIYIPGLVASFDKISVQGGLIARDVEAQGQKIDTLTISTSLVNGQLTAPIEARRKIMARTTTPPVTGPGAATRAAAGLLPAATLPATAPTPPPAVALAQSLTNTTPAGESPQSPPGPARPVPPGPVNPFTTAPADLVVTAPSTQPSMPVEGVLKATVTARLDNRNHIEIAGLTIQNWPQAIESANALLTAGGEADRITIDLPNPRAAREEDRKLQLRSQSVILSADIQAGAPNQPMAPIGNGEITVQLDGRLIDIRRVQADLLGAVVYGQAIVDFDHPLVVRGQIRADNLRADRVAAIVPAAGAVSGAFNLSARIAPSRDPHPLEPLAWEASIEASPGAQYGNSVEIGDGRFRGFLNIDPNWGLVRLVLQDVKQPPMPPVQRPGLPSCPMERPTVPDINTMHLAQGVMKVWGRIVRYEDEAGHEGATSISTHLRLAFQCLDVNDMVHAVSPDAKPVPAKLSGQVVLFGTTSIKLSPAELAKARQREEQARQKGEVLLPTGSTQPTARTPTEPFTAPAEPPPTLLDRIVRNLSGQGSVELRPADLVNVPVIAGLYDILNVGAGDNASGQGSATFRIERDTLYLTSLYYFNRGVEARALATVRELHKIPLSPIEGNAVGSLRPLKDTELPFFSDLDDLLTTIQASSASVAIGGTVKDMEVKPILFGDLSQGMRDFLIGDVKSQVKGSAGR